MYSKALVNPCLSMLYRPFGDLSRVWQYYVGPLVTIAVFGYVICRPFGDLSRVWLCYVGPLVTLAVLRYAM